MRLMQQAGLLDKVKKREAEIAAENIGTAVYIWQAIFMCIPFGLLVGAFDVTVKVQYSEPWNYTELLIRSCKAMPGNRGWVGCIIYVMLKPIVSYISFIPIPLYHQSTQEQPMDASNHGYWIHCRGCLFIIYITQHTILGTNGKSARSSNDLDLLYHSIGSFTSRYHSASSSIVLVFWLKRQINHPSSFIYASECNNRQ